MVIKESAGDRVFNIINHIILFLILAAVLYPLIFVVSASISDPVLVNTGKMLLLPRGLTIDGYIRVFQNSEIMTGYKNTIMYTVAGTLLNLVFTLTSAFALSKKELVGRNVFMLLISFTMYFSGGLIPTYLLISKLKLINTFGVMVIPGLVAAGNLIIARTFFQSTIPHEIEEAAKIDGCSYTRAFLRIVLPLSKPLIAVMALYYSIGHWNSYFSAMLYLRDPSRYPMQLILRRILVQETIMQTMTNQPGAQELITESIRMASLIRYSVIIVSTLPLIIVYPFLQKYFAKGVMIGAIKG